MNDRINTLIRTLAGIACGATVIVCGRMLTKSRDGSAFTILGIGRSVDIIRAADILAN